MTSIPVSVPLSVRTFGKHGYLGIAIMLISQLLMFVKIEPAYSWFTPIQWTGYILFLDALRLKRRGESYLLHRTAEFIFMLLISDACWFLFEAYNLHLQNWYYTNLPENLTVRILGYFWAFATVTPGILLTSEALDDLGFFKRANVPAVRITQPWRWTLMMIGFIFCVAPALAPQRIAIFLFAPVWVGFVLWLDPINYRRGAPSLLAELERGSLQKLLSLFFAGLICGVLWEFWNYWAGSKWIYAVPYFNKPKIFEMPLYGFLGFLPFAAECYVMWHFALSTKNRWMSNAERAR
jgi:hypothetical protein